ncbi:MAG: hypothetical protein ACI9A0_003262 [Pseudoalteromonas tetraodonis]
MRQQALNTLKSQLADDFSTIKSYAQSKINK